MSSTRAIAPGRSVAAAARLGSGGNGLDTIGGGFGAVLGAASEAPGRLLNAAAEPSKAPPQPRERDPRLVAALSATAAQSQPDPASAVDAPTAAPQTAGGKAPPSVAAARGRRSKDGVAGDPQHAPHQAPVVTDAMSLALPLVAGVAAAGAPAAAASGPSARSVDDAAPARQPSAFVAPSARQPSAFVAPSANDPSVGEGGPGPDSDGVPGTLGAAAAAVAGPSGPMAAADTNAAFAVSDVHATKNAAARDDSARQNAVPRAPGLQAAAVTATQAVPAVSAISAAAAPEQLAARPEGDGSAVAAAALSAAGAGGTAVAANVAPAVASAPAPDPGAANLAAQVATRLAEALAPGRLDVVLRLHPPELGELNVHVQVNGHDVAAWFDSPLPQVQQALSQGMGQLHAGLAVAGYSLNNAWIGGDAWTPRDQAAAPPARRPPGTPGGAQDATEPAAVSSAIGSGVSLYV